MTLKDIIKEADWKNEKHVPTIDIIKKEDNVVTIKAQVGKEIKHPNTTEHHIEWIELYFHPEGENFPILLGKTSFSAHGSSAEGPNSSTIYSEPELTVSFQTQKTGTILALSYCNIHGLWSGYISI